MKMAKRKDEKSKNQVEDEQKSVDSEKESTESSTKSTSTSTKQDDPKVFKPYVHIDTFLQTATQLYGLSRVQQSGFKAYMTGKHYQRDEEVFLKALKSYLNIK